MSGVQETPRPGLAETGPPPTSGAVAAPDGSRPTATRTYPNPLPANWWRRNRRYLLYVVRELSSVMVAAWMALFLVEIARLRDGARYEPIGGPAFVAFSLFCLALALFHSFTFLRLAGLIMRIPLGERKVPEAAVAGGAFGLLAAASVVIGLLVVWGGMR